MVLQKFNILLVEDNPSEQTRYTSILRELGEQGELGGYIPCEIDVLGQARDFLGGLDHSDYHLVIISGGGSGFRSLKMLEQVKKISPHTSVILVSDDATVEEAVTAIRQGAEDYLCRPFKLEMFKQAVKRGLDQTKWCENSVQNQQNSGAHQLMYLDDATGLYNTRYLNTVLEREVEQAKQFQNSFAVLFIDVDKFKSVNDSHGHLLGTLALNELGNHIKKFMRKSDTAFRYGGDEFVAVLSPSDLSLATELAEKIRSSVEKGIFLPPEQSEAELGDERTNDERAPIRFTVSIGVALFPNHAQNKKEIIEAADRAMYCAKEKNRNRVVISKNELINYPYRKTPNAVRSSHE